MINTFGKIAAAEIVFYAPVLCTAFFITLRHGFGRQEGWIFLFTFSLVRILGAVLSIVAQTATNPSTGLQIAVGILQGIGLSPLLLATLGFVTNIASYGMPSLTRPLRLNRLLLTAGLVLAIIGGIKLSPTNTVSEQNTGHTLSKAGVACFVIGYIVLFGMHVLLWGVKENIPAAHRKLLTSLSLALPFLAVRVLYSVLSIFVGGEWSMTTGKWQLYLVMGLIMEYIVVCTYVFTGVMLPLKQDAEQQLRGHVVYPPTGSDDGLLEMGNKRYNPIQY